MKKMLVLILVIITVISCFAITGCDEKDVVDINGDPSTIETQKNSTSTTTEIPSTTTTDPFSTTDPDPSTTVTTTSPNPQSSTVTTTIPNTTPTTICGPGCLKLKGMNGVDYDDENNQNKVVNGVFTSSNGGIQIEAEGWKTYNLYSISFVPQSYTNVGQTNAVCVAVYPKGSDGYDSQTVFENKTQKDFEDVLQTGINSFEKTTISSNGKTYTCYKAVVTDTYYVWVFQTPEAKYFINFMQAPLDNGGWAFASEAAAMMATIQIYK